VVRLTDEIALVQTVDFFPPMVDDATWFGRIAAANALSDVWAMGGTPHSCTDVLALPADVPTNVPAEILNGAIEKVVEAGAVLVGGHTITDKELKFGLAVTGTIHPDPVVTNAGARPRDVLVLTKPLGSGYLCTALRGGRLTEEEALRVMEVMATLNGPAAAAMVEAGAHAATDVTGFGLTGHALGMADGANVTIRIRAKDLPRLPGVEAHMTEKDVCGGLKRNLAYAASRTAWGEGVTEADRGIAADPQTSGGMLIAVAPDRLMDLLDGLAARGVETRAVVGEVVPRRGAALEVV
jgi:selenide,water dikinase